MGYMWLVIVLASITDLSMVKTKLTWNKFVISIN